MEKWLKRFLVHWEGQVETECLVLFSMAQMSGLRSCLTSVQLLLQSRKTSQTASHPGSWQIQLFPITPSKILQKSHSCSQQFNLLSHTPVTDISLPCALFDLLFNLECRSIIICSSILNSNCAHYLSDTFTVLRYCLAGKNYSFYSFFSHIWSLSWENEILMFPFVIFTGLKTDKMKPWGTTLRK